jgi:phosphoribosyl-ATP pyrophosphohydrolase/phosphoribosyl-AMP cyclohydrolase
MDSTQHLTSTQRRALRLADVDTLDFAKGGGLLPAIVQHAGSGAVLMLGYMNREALVASLTRRRVVFFSRSKRRLWEKGETSGHSLEVREIHTDCDADALLVTAWPRGAVCHLGRGSCFGDSAQHGQEALSILATLEQIISERMKVRPEGSYTAELLQSGRQRIAQKVGEEGLEVALAGACGNEQQVVHEAADLFYHLLVLLKARGLSLEHVLQELETRHLARMSAPGASSACAGSYADITR